ncbi:MAG: lipoate--protein ligase [Planctomycetota bacterium]|nr:MAG: lipoate--protein ligase [Planctomycetota bacterium]
MTASKLPLPCQLILDGPETGGWQMAVDEALLEAAADNEIAYLRFYGWSEPTLSLGYFQPYRDRERHAASRDCPLVRRQTGGGAILHDRELTYCLTVPLAHPLAADTTRLYEAVHGALVDVLAGFGCVAQINRGPVAAMSEEPFLCFQRRAPLDVLSGSAKICGSAQRRRRGAVLQHGSLLLAASSHAPQLPGLVELTNQELSPRSLAQSWQAAIAGRLQLRLEPAELGETARRRARLLVRERYGSQAWNQRR